MAIWIRLAPELEQQLDRLAQSLGKTRSACVREAIAHYLHRFDGDDEAKRQSSLIAASNSTQQWSEPLPGWRDWLALH